MPEQWTLADLDAEQLRLVDETEHALPGNVVLVFAPTRWGTVDDETLDAEGLHPVELEPEQLARLQEVERRVGGVAVAYRMDDHRGEAD
jgi:hypothetical protein